MSPVARIETDEGDAFFLKWNDGDQPAGMLAAEAWGLALLAEAGEVRVPDVLGGSSVRDVDAATDAPDREGGAEWLLLEWLEPGVAAAGAWERLGGRLADLHRHTGPTFGADADNFIGPLPQSNAPGGSWPEFWVERRIRPQLAIAADAGSLGAAGARRLDALLDRADEVIGVAEEEGPSLLHGDLWSGNVHTTAGGEHALIDPSVYHGHREVDLAMAELFGGFAPAFLQAYREAWPLEPGYAPRRRAMYQLYYLLVHVNLFGAGYVGRTLRALEAAGG